MSLNKELSKLFPQCGGSPWDLYLTKFLNKCLSYDHHFQLALKAQSYEKLSDETKHYIKCCQYSNEIAEKKGYDTDTMTDEQLKDVFREVLKLLPNETLD